MIPMLLKIDVFSVDLRIMTKRSAPTPLALIARMSQPLPSDLSAVQITQLVSKASKERSNLDDLLIQKLSAFQECETALSAAKKEFQIHRKIETARREMERDLKNVDDQIKALELKKHEEKERYEEKLRVLQRVTLHTYSQ